MFVAIVCDDGWVPYNNQCYFFSTNADIFPNAVVSFDIMAITKNFLEFIYCITIIKCFKYI